MQEKIHIPDHFDAMYKKSVKDLGFRNSDTDARVFVAGLQLHHGRVDEVRSIFLNAPDAHVYDGVKEHLSTLIADGHHITIWTQGETHGDPKRHIPGYAGQLRKVAKSGLRREVFGDGPIRKEQFRVVSVEQKKERVIPDILSFYEQKQIRHAIIVDDKAENVVAAHAEAMKAKANGIYSGEVTVVWMRQGRSKDTLPAGFSDIESFTAQFPTVHSYAAFEQFDAQFRQSHPDEKIGYTFDWDHTLADETARKNEIRDLITEKYHDLQGETQYLPPEDSRFGAICELLDIPVSRALIEPLGDGASFVGVYRVNWDGKTVVVKHEHHPDRIWRMIEEKRGYETIFSQDGVFARVMPQIHRSINHPVLGETLVMDYFDGSNLRHAIREGELTDVEVLDVVDQVLDKQYHFWKNQQSQLERNHTEWFSMPKQEWDDTEKHMALLMDTLAQKLKTKPEEIAALPIHIHTGEQQIELPSFQRLVGDMQKIVLGRPNVVLPLGFNDLSHGNIVVVHEKGKVKAKIVDPQWVRPHANPYADMVRPMKVVSSTTVHIADGQTYRDEQGLHFIFHADVPPLLPVLEEHVFEQLDDFGHILGDSEFAAGVLREMAASQFREIALVAKGRGSMAQIGFNLFHLDRYLQLAETRKVEQVVYAASNTL